MPQAIYTAAKGLYEEAGSGFSISGAPIILGTQSVELQQIKYTLDCANLVAADEENQNTTYQNETFVLYDASGTATTFLFEVDEQGTGSIPQSSLTTETAISFADTAVQNVIITAIKNAIDGVAGFNAVVDGTNVVVYSVNPGVISSSNIDVVEAQTPADDLITIAVNAAGATSSVSSSLSDTTNQIHGAGLSVVTLEQDNGDAAIKVAFADGSSVGQEKFINSAATEDVILTGLFNDNSAGAGTELTITSGELVWLIWNGSAWCTVNGQGAVA